MAELRGDRTEAFFKVGGIGVRIEADRSMKGDGFVQFLWFADER